MILQLIKTVVKNTLHQAAEEWAEEFGLPESEVLQLRERRLAAAEKELCRLREHMQTRNDGANGNVFVGDRNGDAVLRQQIGAEADDQSSAAKAATDGFLSETDDDFLQWVHDQRHNNATWADITQAATEKGRQLSESSLR